MKIRITKLRIIQKFDVGKHHRLKNVDCIVVQNTLTLETPEKLIK